MDGANYESGTYFSNNKNGYTSLLTYGSFKKLDPKYLPEGGVGYEETVVSHTLTWDGIIDDDTVVIGGDKTNAQDKFIKVSDLTPTLEQVLAGGAIELKELGTIQFTADDVENINDEIISIKHRACLVVLVDGASIHQLYGGDPEDYGDGFPEKGIYFLEGVTSLTLNGYNFTRTEVHKIDEKYLPNILPEVVLTTPLGEDFTDEENAALTAAYSTSKPVILRVAMDGASICCAMDNIRSTGISGLIGEILGLTILLSQDDAGKWIQYLDDSNEDIDLLRVEVSDLSFRVSQNESDIEELKNSGGIQGPEGPQGPDGPAGADGYTPQRGLDYWTDGDVQEIRAYIDDAVANMDTSGGVPTVTEADNGKFLQVVNGAYALVALRDLSEEGM